MKSNGKKPVYRASFDDEPRFDGRAPEKTKRSDAFDQTPWDAEGRTSFSPAEPPQDDYDYLYPDDALPPDIPQEIPQSMPDVPRKMLPVRPKKPVSKKHKKKKRSCWGAVALLSFLMLAGLVGFIVSAYSTYAPFRRRVANTQSGVIADGIFIDDVGVGGMTKTQALTILTYGKDAVGQSLRIAVRIDDQTYIMTESEVPFTRSTQAVIDQAYAIGRQNSVQTLGSSVTPFKWRSDNLDYIREHGAYLYTEMAYDQGDIARFVDQILKSAETLPQDATVASFDFNSRSFTFTDEVYGKTADREEIIRKITEALDKKQYEAVLSFDLTPATPTVTKTMLLNSFAKIADIQMSTTADPSRNANILLATRSINGRVLYPDETFSLNAALGQRTVSKGYISAPEDPLDETTKVVGGGVSQVASALFYTVLTADLTVVSRTAFPYAPSCIMPGLDAYIDESTDFRFRNSTTYPVFIVAGYAQGRSMTLPGTITIEIYGVTSSAGTTVSLDTILVSESEEPAAQFRQNTALPAGTQKTVRQGSGACQFETYRVLTQNGREMMRELKCISAYPSCSAIIEYN